jgi:hypothetical protein
MSEDVVGGDCLAADEPVLQYFAACTYAGISDAVVGALAGSRCVTAATATPAATSATATATMKRFIAPASCLVTGGLSVGR